MLIIYSSHNPDSANLLSNHDTDLAINGFKINHRRVNIQKNHNKINKLA